MSTHKGHPRLFNTETDILPLLQPASDLTILLLKDVVVHCKSCDTDMRVGAYPEIPIHFKSKLFSDYITG